MCELYHCVFNQYGECGADIITIQEDNKGPFTMAVCRGFAEEELAQ
jgi:hypothetical protein